MPDDRKIKLDLFNKYSLNIYYDFIRNQFGSQLFVYLISIYWSPFVPGTELVSWSTVMNETAVIAGMFTAK